jgi:hypothetical protein
MAFDCVHARKIMGLPIDDVRWYPGKDDVPEALADGTIGIKIAWDKDKSPAQKKREEEEAARTAKVFSDATLALMAKPSNLELQYAEAKAKKELK